MSKLSSFNSLGGNFTEPVAEEQRADRLLNSLTAAVSYVPMAEQTCHHYGGEVVAAGQDMLPADRRLSPPMDLQC